MRYNLIHASLLLAVTTSWFPLNAQVASVTLFGSESRADVANGKRDAKNAFVGFALNQSPIRSARRLASATTERRSGSLAYFSTLPGRSIGDACGTSGIAPPRHLSSRAMSSRLAYWPMIAEAECRFGLPTGLMDSLILAESRYDPTVSSPAGAVGLAQLMPGTASDLGITDRFDPAASILGGARYLRQLLDRFAGNVPLALAAYNAGPAAVGRAGGIPLNDETPEYVRRVLAHWIAPGIGPMSPALSARQTAQMLGFAPSVRN